MHFRSRIIAAAIMLVATFGAALTAPFHGGFAPAVTTTPQFTAIALSGNQTFTAGAAATIGTATATVSSGPNTPTWSIVTTGTDHAGTTCSNYSSSFAVGSSTGVLTATSSTAVQAYPGVCLQAAQSGLSSYVQAFTLTGQAASAASIFDTTRNAASAYSFSSDKLTATLSANAPNSSAFTTIFHSDVKRFWRFTIKQASAPSGCHVGIGVASSTEVSTSGAYLGHSGAQSVGLYADGGTSLNNASLGNSGVTFATGDIVDLIVDPGAQTIQAVKNNGTPAVALNIANLATQNVSPGITTCGTNDAVVYNGNPTGVTYSGVIAWDATPPPPQFTSITLSPQTFTAGSTNPVGTAAASVSSGSSAPTWSIQTSGTDHAGTTCVNYATAFTINSSSGVVTPASTNTVQNYPGFCVQATQSGLSNSPYSQAFTLVGQPVTTGSVFDTTRNTGNVFSFSTDKLTVTQTAASGTDYTAFTTGFHSDVKRFFRMTATCNAGFGAASSTVPNAIYLGQDTQSFGLYYNGNFCLNGNSVGCPSSGVFFNPGDTVDLIIDPVAKTVQEVVNGGTPSSPISISAMATQNLSPAAEPCQTSGGAATFNGNPIGIGYNGAIAWDATPGPAVFSSIQMSNKSFIAGSTASVGTATATVTSGSNSPTWSIKTAGNDSLGNPCSNYGTNLSMNPSTGVVTPAAAAPVQSYPGFCPQATQSGVANSPYSQALTLIGNAPSPLVAIVTPSSTTEVCNVPGGTQVAAVTSSGGNGNPINGVSLTAGGTDFALSSTTGLPSNVIIASGGITSSGHACATLPTGGATETVPVQISQP